MVYRGYNICFRDFFEKMFLKTIVAHIYNRATMTTQDDLEATINIQQLKEGESEEYYGKNINSVESQGREVKEQGSQMVSNCN